MPKSIHVYLKANTVILYRAFIVDILEVSRFILYLSKFSTLTWVKGINGKAGISFLALPFRRLNQSYFKSLQVRFRFFLHNFSITSFHDYVVYSR